MASLTPIDFAYILALSLCVMGLAKAWQRFKDKVQDKYQKPTP